jgi:pheromone shutdown protein TraB
MITLIGVGHVFAISENVKEIIRSKRPEVVCLELDQARYNALVQKEHTGAVPLQYKLLAYFQRRMADKFGTEVGDEMMAAVGAAQEVGARVALIDLDATRVFSQLWKRMSMKERINLLWGGFAGLFVSKKVVEKEMDKYEGNEEQYLEALGEGFPTIKEVLIDDRNKHMALQLSSLAAQHKNIIAVVGDGHISGILASLGTTEVETVRLKDIRAGKIVNLNASEHTTTFWYNSP